MCVFYAIIQDGDNGAFPCVPPLPGLHHPHVIATMRLAVLGGHNQEISRYVCNCNIDTQGLAFIHVSKRINTTQSLLCLQYNVHVEFNFEFFKKS